MKMLLPGVNGTRLMPMLSLNYCSYLCSELPMLISPKPNEKKVNLLSLKMVKSKQSFRLRGSSEILSFLLINQLSKLLRKLAHCSNSTSLFYLLLCWPAGQWSAINLGFFFKWNYRWLESITLQPFKKHYCINARWSLLTKRDLWVVWFLFNDQNTLICHSFCCLKNF